MRISLLATLFVLFAASTASAAGDYTFVSYDKEKKELTLKNKDGKTTKAKITDKTKGTYYPMAGNPKEMTAEEIEMGCRFMKPTTPDGDYKFVVKDGVVTEAHFGNGNVKE